MSESNLYYYTLHQNNSGGYYIQNEDVDAFVSIQAHNVEEAQSIAEEILDCYRDYCPCCGERWDDDFLREKNASIEPLIYNKSYKEMKDEFWCRNNKIIIYHYDGTKEIYDLEQNLGEK